MRLSSGIARIWATSWFFVGAFSVVCLVGLGGCGGGEEGAGFKIGPEGGTVSLERFALEVPPNLVPEPTTIRIIERGGLGAELASELDPAKYVAIGPSYEIETPLRTHEAMLGTLSFEATELPEGFDAEHLAVFTWSEAVWESGPDQQATPGTLPERAFAPRAVDVDVDAGTVGFHVFGRLHVQLVALMDPIRVSGATDEPAPATQRKAPGVQQEPLVITPGPWIILMPEITAAYDDADEAILMGTLRDALNTSHATMSEQGFPVPPIDTLTIVAKKLPAGTWGVVRPKEPRVIEIDPLQAKGVLNSLVGHEFFHVVQRWCNNLPSYFEHALQDRWFIEGGSEWARDLVYDGVVGDYKSPKPERLQTQLNLPSEQPSEPEPYLYETVVFWKWLEARYAGTLATMAHLQRAATHTTLGPKADIENAFKTSWMDSFKAAQPAVAFHRFFEDALWNKDFDTDEQGTGDLWNTLGAPKELADAYRKIEYTLKKDGAGDGEANLEPVHYLLASHLAAEGVVIKNSTGGAALRGTLHLRFAPTSPHLFAAAVIHDDTLQSVMDVSAGEEVKVPFGDGDEVFVLVSDPRFLPADKTQTAAGIVEVWVDSEEPPSTWPSPPEIDRRGDIVGGAAAVDGEGTSYKKQCTTSTLSYPEGTQSFRRTGCIIDTPGNRDDQSTLVEIEPRYLEPFSESVAADAAADGIEATASIEGTLNTSVDLSETELVIRGSTTASASATSTQDDSGGGSSSTRHYVEFWTPYVDYELTWDCGVARVQLHVPGGPILIHESGLAPTWRVENCEKVEGKLSAGTYWFEVQARAQAASSLGADPGTQTNGGSFRLVLKPRPPSSP